MVGQSNEGVQQSLSQLVVKEVSREKSSSGIDPLA